MNLKDLMAALQGIESDRKLTKEIVVDALQEALAKAFRKHIEIPDALVRVDVNNATGMIKVYQQRTIVETVDDDELEISLADAQAINQELALGGVVEDEVDITTFGRAAVILAKNVMKQKIREAEKVAIYEEFCDKVGEMMLAKIESVEEKFCVVNIENTLAIMPKNQQIPNEHYKDGEQILLVISEVNKETKGAQILVSRADPTLVKRLFEKEVPEIFQGIIEIKAIARDAGERTKMAVYSHNENIDPIGACIGPRGQRVQVVINELGGEKIDIFEWSEDVSELIKNALAPAEVLAVIPNSEPRGGLLVVVPDLQLSLAIGKRGKNARLAVKLTNNKIDIKGESEVSEAGIDWKQIAAKQHEEFLQKQQQEKQAAQMERFEENANEEVEAFHFDDVVQSEEVVPHVEQPEEVVQEPISTAEEPNVAVCDANEETIEPPHEEKEPQVDHKPEEKTVATDLEIAARIAKEKQKSEGLNVKEKQEYKSKFETLADASLKSEPKAFVRAKHKRSDEKEERKATFDLKEKDYEMKPIYSAEELEEIERRQKEEEENDWIHDEIDFDEYDKYYEE